MRFPVQKLAIFRKVKENKELRGGVRQYVAQETLQFDAKIAEKSHLRMETRIRPRPFLEWSAAFPFHRSGYLQWPPGRPLPRRSRIG